MAHIFQNPQHKVFPYDYANYEIIWNVCIYTDVVVVMEMVSDCAGRGSDGEKIERATTKAKVE